MKTNVHLWNRSGFVACFGVGLAAGLATAVLPAPTAKASSCDGPERFGYEFVEVRLLEGSGDPASQTLWSDFAHFQPNPNGDSKFFIFSGTSPEGDYLLFEEVDS